MYEHQYTMAASRIGGCLNFACFLPPDDTRLPPLYKSSLATSLKLLSSRSYKDSIPVYRDIFQAGGTPDNI